MPYILMEAMPGKRLWGGGLADLIPDAHKSKVYGQITDIVLQLYRRPFDKIGMLWPSRDNGVEIGVMHDQHFRLPPYGPFTTSLEFYQARAKMLAEFKAKQEPKVKVHHSGIHPEDIPEACHLLVDPEHVNGPFYLAHPDFQVSNFLFDDEFNITGVLDWTGCQTVPLESFANPPMNIVPDDVEH